MGVEHLLELFGGASREMLARYGESEGKASDMMVEELDSGIR